MLNGLDAADRVLLVCTPTYYRRFRGHEGPGQGKGVDWEGAIITQGIYDARSTATRFIPVIFDPADAAQIPEPLRGPDWLGRTSAAVVGKATSIAEAQLPDSLPGQSDLGRLLTRIRASCG